MSSPAWLDDPDYQEQGRLLDALPLGPSFQVDLPACTCGHSYGSHGWKGCRHGGCFAQDCPCEQYGGR